jgi:hypothetical protein
MNNFVRRHLGKRGTQLHLGLARVTPVLLELELARASAILPDDRTECARAAPQLAPARLGVEHSLERDEYRERDRDHEDSVGSHLLHFRRHPVTERSAGDYEPTEEELHREQRLARALVTRCKEHRNVIVAPRSAQQ